jgi:hypothetical protein
MKERWQRHYMKGEKVSGGHIRQPRHQAEVENADAAETAIAGPWWLGGAARRQGHQQAPLAPAPAFGL